MRTKKMIKIPVRTIDNALDHIFNALEAKKIKDPLDMDEVDDIIEQVRLRLNYRQGNLSRSEYENANQS